MENLFSTDALEIGTERKSLVILESVGNSVDFAFQYINIVWLSVSGSTGSKRYLSNSPLSWFDDWVDFKLNWATNFGTVIGLIGEEASSQYSEYTLCNLHFN